MNSYRWLLIGLLGIVGTGCTTSAPLEPRELVYTTPSDETFREAVDLMVEQGYVVRHADLSLGRAEAALARWPGYRVQLQVSEEGSGSRVRVSALRGNQPLPPYLLDPWLVALQHKLGVAP